MDDRPVDASELKSHIRWGLSQLRRRNGHHEFEDLCLSLARAKISPNFLPATGPVSAGGDQGRDFETFRSYVCNTPSDGSPSPQLVGICTLQTSGLTRKIMNDLAKVAAGTRVDGVYVFCEADIDVSTRHKLIDFARNQYHLHLEIFDGNGLATQLADPELLPIAARILHLPYDLLRRARTADPEASAWARRVFPHHPRSELHRFLQAVRVAVQEHPQAFRFRLSTVLAPSLLEAYVPPDLVDLTAKGNHVRSVPAEARTTWAALLDQHEHLLICGPAGTGKSSLLWHIAGSLADQWLAGRPAPCVPVRVHARHLAHDRPLTEALHNAATRTLGSKLTHTLPDNLFDFPPAPASTWLVLIDGLDEIRNMEIRDSVISMIVDALRASPWRLVVATRPLPADELGTLRRQMREAEVLPLDDEGIKQFANHWLRHLTAERRDSTIGQIQRHARLEGLGNTPLVMAMLCAMLVEDPAASLPDNRTTLYEEAFKLLRRPPVPFEDESVSRLRARSDELLEEIAFERHCGDWETPLLDMALTWANQHNLQPNPHLSNRWTRIVHDVLCDTGLVTSGENDLTFSHYTIEEHLAARKFVTLTEDARHIFLRDLLQVDLNSFDETADALEESTLLETLVNLWVAADRDPDILITELLETSTATCGGVLQLVINGVPVGASTVAALIKISSDRWTCDRERIAVAKILCELDINEGIEALLALSIDLDIDEDDRLDIMRFLIDATPDKAASIRWLTFAEYWDSDDMSYKERAAAIVNYSDLDDEDETDGLQIIATNPRLPDKHRALASKELLDKVGDSAFNLLKEKMGIHRLTLAAEEIAYRGNIDGYNLLHHIANSSTLNDAQRSRTTEALKELH